jgi:hypothetical protein
LGGYRGRFGSRRDGRLLGVARRFYASRELGNLTRAGILSK